MTSKWPEVECIEVAHNGRLRIIQDEDAESPREYDNLGVMACKYRGYNLGDREPDEDEIRAAQRGWNVLRRYLRMKEGAVVVLPLSVLDHSGMTMWVGSGEHACDPGGWDTSLVGFVYATTKRCEELGVEAKPDEVERQLRAEVEEYDKYLRGDVYGYVLEDEWGTELDSCWSFIGYDIAVAEGKAAATAYDEELKKARNYVAQYQEATT